MEKPSPIFPPWESEESVAMTEFIPIIRPWASISAPPEFPGLIAASV